MTLAGIDPRPIVETETHRYADAAVELLERYAGQTQPFFLRLDFEGPHYPYLPPQPFASWYDPAQIHSWPNFSDPLDHKPMAQRRLLEQRGVAHLTWQDWQVLIARYFGYMSFIDDEIGRVLRRLEELQLSNDTVILHLSDHGDMTGAHGGQFNKGPLMYDELYHTPLIVRAPGCTQPNSQCDVLVHSFDLMPTILELAQLALPVPVDGQSLLPLLRRERDVPLLDGIFAEYSGEEWGSFSQRMLRTHTWKYVYNPHAIDECYNLREDPYELHNLIDDPAYTEIIQQLRRRLREWMVETQDPLARWTSRLF
ncbi:MAG: sulfatase-like hydrolase/transferase [Firmicutes bacterium]|nr:sulfatase-like hydrolase/transferase [Bacillota bacterium]